MVRRDYAELAPPVPFRLGLEVATTAAGFGGSSELRIGCAGRLHPAAGTTGNLAVG
jgi:hypothetical protein